MAWRIFLHNILYPLKHLLSPDQFAPFLEMISKEGKKPSLETAEMSLRKKLGKQIPEVGEPGRENG